AAPLVRGRMAHGVEVFPDRAGGGGAALHLGDHAYRRVPRTERARERRRRGRGRGTARELASVRLESGDPVAGGGEHGIEPRSCHPCIWAVFGWLGFGLS